MEPATDSIRAFLAIELSDGVRASLAALTTHLRKSAPKVSWVQPQNMHLTLRFLGDIAPSALDLLLDELARPLCEIECFHLSVQGIGAFPNQRKPAVIWASIGDPSERLFEAQALTESAARSIGLEPEERPFTPHITLGRVRDRRQPIELFDAIERDEEFRAGEFSVHAVSLFSSELTPEAAIHRKLKEFSLNGPHPLPENRP